MREPAAADRRPGHSPLLLAAAARVVTRERNSGPQRSLRTDISARPLDAALRPVDSANMGGGSGR